MIKQPNERTSGNGAVPFSFTIQRLSRAVPECERSAFLQQPDNSFTDI
jgi:hypothetical protein